MTWKSAMNCRPAPSAGPADALAVGPVTAGPAVRRADAAPGI
ncbi:hypothetical protein [Streptacidiphilus albus]|nr:hypothetical protein [Streptacidiphilus albus]